MADKGDVYHCGWLKNDDGSFVGWLKNRPSIRREGESFNEMLTELGEAIGEYHNDHEAALDFDPPYVEDEQYARFYVDGIRCIGWNSGFRIEPPAAQAFVGGRCPQCGGALGPRTLDPLPVQSLASEADGANCHPGSTISDSSMPAGLTIFSEAFLKLLTDEELRRFDIRPVKRPPQSRKKFFEIFPKAFVPNTRIAGMKYAGWRCDSCQRISAGHESILGWATHSVCREDLPSPIPSLFFVGHALNVNICMTAARYRELAGQTHAKKLISCGGLAVVPAGECDRSSNADLPTLDELAAFRKKHGFKVAFFRE